MDDPFCGTDLLMFVNEISSHKLYTKIVSRRAYDKPIINSNYFKSNHLLLMNDKRIRKTVVLKHGNAVFYRNKTHNTKHLG